MLLRKQYGTRTYVIRVTPRGVSGWRADASICHVEKGVIFTDFSIITGFSEHSPDKATMRAEVQVLMFIDCIDG